MREYAALTGRTVAGICVAIVMVTALSGKGCPAGNEPEAVPEKQTPGIPAVKVTVLYDNNEHDERLETAWGFGCLIEGLEKTILFDTGGSSRILLANMRKLNIDPARVDVVVISHVHGDHIGGLAGFLEKNNDVSVYLPRALPESKKQLVKNSGASLVEVHEPANICRGALSTGELGREIKEQSLLVETPEGPLLITGCAHPGIVNIVRHAKTRIDGEVFMAMGGFHLTGADVSRVQGIVDDIKSLGVRAAAPCHCSGEVARRLFKQAYAENYYPAGAGWRHRFENPKADAKKTD